MQALFIGGTGNISGTGNRLALQRGIDFCTLYRGRRPLAIPSVPSPVGDIRDAAGIAAVSVCQKPLRHPVVTESAPLCNSFWEFARREIEDA